MTNETLIEYKKLLRQELLKRWWVTIQTKNREPRTKTRIDQLHATINHQKELLREYEVTKKIENEIASVALNSIRLKKRSEKHKKYKEKVVFRIKIESNHI